MTFRLLFFILAILAVSGQIQAQAPTRQPLLVPGMSIVFQRVISRPGATISPSPSRAGAKEIPAFSVFYVYGRAGGPNGWVEVGAAPDGQIKGWIPNEKAIDWKHTLVAAFTNPSGRKPVLFLDSERSERLLMLDREAGVQADRMRANVTAGHPGAVVATEPADFVDINRSFYLLPILDSELIEPDLGPPLRLLKVMSAPAEPPLVAGSSRDALSKYKAAVVFVIDTAASMEPYIDGTREAIRSIVSRIATTSARDSFRFGVVAYRGSLKDNPGLEYSPRVFMRPDFGRSPLASVTNLDQVHKSPVLSTGFDADSIGGIKAALDDIDWNALSARYIVLITDSGARVSTHPFSLTRLGIAEIRLRAQEKRVAVMTLHLLTPEGARRNDHDLAAAQYRELTQFNGTEPLYFPIKDGSPEAFQRSVEWLVETLLQNVARATGMPAEVLRLPDPPPRANIGQMREQLGIVSEAMRLNYVGRITNVQAPDVPITWTTDRDLGKRDISALEIRVLLTRNQLSDLAAVLTTILETGLANRMAPQTFFSQLQATLAAAATDPRQISHARSIGELMGEYLNGLPYRSEIMSISQDDWTSMGPIQQRVTLNNVESRLRLYREFQAQSELWRDVSHSGKRGEEVYPVPLDALP